MEVTGRFNEQMLHRIAVSERRMMEQELLITRWRAAGDDTTGAVRALDEMKVARRSMLELTAKRSVQGAPPSAWSAANKSRRL
jgi:hypothetical protein